MNEKYETYDEETKKLIEELRPKEVPLWEEDGIVKYNCKQFQAISSGYGSVSPDFNFTCDKTIFNRDIYVRKYGFVVLGYEMLNHLANFFKNNGNRVLSIMSGSCSLEKELFKRDVNIICTDDNSWSKDYENFDINKTDTDMKKYQYDCVEAIKRFGDKVDFVLCSWPPYAEKMAYDALTEMRNHKHLKMIYIGEDEGGCTADINFFEAIKYSDLMNTDKEFIEAMNSFIRWYALHDDLYIVE
jgi:16S rRNA G966 N2-methylase RsmD